MEEQVLKRFGQQLKNLRIEKGLTQEQLALESGLDRTYVSSVERGLRNLSLLNIVKFANALQVEPLALLVEITGGSK